MRRLYFLFLLFLPLVPGSLDVSFGTGGVIYNLFPAGVAATHFMLDGAGRIVVIGNQSNDPFSIMAARFDADGIPDTTFGNNGTVTLNLPYANAYGQRVAVDGLGRILIAGDTDDTAYFVVRLNADGSFDATFDGDGMLSEQFEAGKPSLLIGLLADNLNRVIVGGTSSDTLALARYTDAGAVDTHFGGTGKVVLTLGGVKTWMNDFAVDGNNRIIAAGGINAATSGFSVARIRQNGTLDPNFSVDGYDIQNLGDNGYARAVTVMPDGRILAVGSSALGVGMQDMNGAMLRYHPDGTLDTTFGSGGIVTGLDFYEIDIFTDAFVDGSGNILVAGHTGVNQATDAHLLLARYTANGSADGSFGEGGMSMQNFSLYDDFTQIAASGDKLLAMGSTRKQTFLARYHLHVSTDNDRMKNGSFEINTTRTVVPNSWKATNRSGDAQRCNTFKTWFASKGVCSYQFKGSAYENSRLDQGVSAAGLTAGRRLGLVAVIKAGGNVDIQITAKIVYGDKTQTTLRIRTRAATSGEYRIFSTSKVLAKNVRSIKVTIQNRGKSGSVLIDNVQLVDLPANARSVENGWLPLPPGTD